jgi:allene oxide cyclase-like protein
MHLIPEGEGTMRTKIMIAAVLAVLFAVAGVTLAAADSNGSGDDDQPRVIKLFAFNDPDRSVSVDVPPTGGTAPTLGDGFVFSGDVFDHKGGTRLGTTAVQCTIVRLEPPTEAVLQCVATISLEGGQITIHGVFTSPLAEGALPAPFDLAVTGGTGDYEGAEGHLTVKELSDTEENLTVTLND